MNAVAATPKIPNNLPVNIEVEQALLGAISSKSNLVKDVC